VLADHVGEDVVAALADGGEPHVGGRGEVPPGPGGQVGEERPAKAVAVEDAMPGGAPDAALLAAIKERDPPGHGRYPVVDLVSADRLAECAPGGPGERLVGRELYPRGQQAQPRYRSGVALHIILNRGGEHLIPAADSQYGEAAGGPFGNGSRDACLTQPAQVADGGPAARQDHQVRAGHLARRGDQVHGDARLGCQGVHVGDIGHPGEPDDRDPQNVRPHRVQHLARPGVQVEGVLGLQPQIPPPWQYPVRGAAGHRGQHVQARD
jgi:hypothetical protein